MPRLRRAREVSAAQISKRKRIGELAHQDARAACSRGSSPYGEHRCVAPRALEHLRHEGVEFNLLELHVSIILKCLASHIRGCLFLLFGAIET